MYTIEELTQQKIDWGMKKTSQHKRIAVKRENKLKNIVKKKKNFQLKNMS